MKKYKLIEENNGKKTMDKLNFFVYVHELIAKYDDISKEKINALKTEIIVIESFQEASSDNSLNEYLRYKYLTIREAVFCLVGLNPNIVKVIKDDSLVYQALKETKEFEHLMRAEEDEFISNSKGTVSSKGFIKWMIENEYVYTAEESIENVDPKAKDKETGIPMHRYKIYTQTLPEYLKQLKQLNPISTNGLSTTDAGKIGEYTIINQVTLNRSPGTIRADLGKLYKSAWWKNQPEEIRSKWEIKHK